ncbi:MAG: hypothetical protein KHX46_09535 [Clostridiales bacterium]|nr:hypothetical protein [Clostridiales bacterium]
MQLQKIEKKKTFTTLYYTLTYPIGWEQMLSIVHTVIESDFLKSCIQALEIGEIAGSALKDVTAELKRANHAIHYTSVARKEAGVLAISGHSSIMEASMRLTFYNLTNRCMLQVLADKAIRKCGKHAYDKYMDSVELGGWIDYTKRQMEKAPENERSGL